MCEYRDTSHRAEIVLLDIYIQFWYPLNLIYAGTAGASEWPGLVNTLNKIYHRILLNTQNKIYDGSHQNSG
eukprot:SAG31_NODE_26417_length_442_cov_2.046647_1_plen_71_part_00